MYGHPDAVEARGAARDAKDATAFDEALECYMYAGETLNARALKVAEDDAGYHGDIDNQVRLILMCAAGHKGAQAQCMKWARDLAWAVVEAS